MKAQFAVDHFTYNFTPNGAGHTQVTVGDYLFVVPDTHAEKIFYALVPQADPPVHTGCQMEGALCAWEQMLEWRESNEVLKALWEDHGTGCMRALSIVAGSICDQLYKLMESQDIEYIGSYDWGFVPEALLRIDWPALLQSDQYGGPPYEPNLPAMLVDMMNNNTEFHQN